MRKSKEGNDTQKRQQQGRYRGIPTALCGPHDSLKAGAIESPKLCATITDHSCSAWGVIHECQLSEGTTGSLCGDLIAVHKDFDTAFLDDVEVVAVAALLHYHVAIFFLHDEKCSNDGVHTPGV